MGYVVWAVARVESALRDPAAAPRQGDEGAPDAWIVVDPSVREAWRDVAVGDELIVVTFLDRADRSALAVHPRGDTSAPRRGVFSTRSPHRPNPIGLHEVRGLERGEDRMRVRDLEAVDGTPVLDIKPVLGPVETR